MFNVVVVVLHSVDSHDRPVRIYRNLGCHFGRRQHYVIMKQARHMKGESYAINGGFWQKPPNLKNISSALN